MVLPVSARSYCRINVLTIHVLRLIKKVCGRKREVWILINHMWIWMPKFCPHVQKCFLCYFQRAKHVLCRQKLELKVLGSENTDTHTASQSSTAAVVQ